MLTYVMNLAAQGHLAKQLLPNNLPYRMASNNYYLGQARLLTLMALSIDPSDDPPVNPAVEPSQIGNSLRSYILDANGAWLYQMWAMMGDPGTENWICMNLLCFPTIAPYSR